MSSTAIQLTVSLVTILLSGVVASVVTFRLNARREDRDFLARKLEQAYTALENGADALASAFLPYFRAFRQEMTLNQVLDLTIEHGRSQPRPSHIHTLDLMVNLYFPSARTHLREFYACRSQLNATVAKYTDRYKAGNTDGSDLVPVLREQLEELEAVVETFRSYLLKISERFAKL